MVRINRVYTGGGDDGTTALVGGARVAKDDLRIETYGTVDELNSVIGVAIASGLAEEMRERFFVLQQVLFNLGTELATPPADRERFAIPCIEERHVRDIEGWIDDWNDQLEPLTSFILPGGDLAAAQLHVARTVCRRAERLAIGLNREAEVGKDALVYLNRLSDFLFVAARYQARLSGQGEVLWDSRRF